MDFILVNALAIDMEWINKLQKWMTVNFKNENYNELRIKASNAKKAVGSFTSKSKKEISSRYSSLKAIGNDLLYPFKRILGKTKKGSYIKNNLAMVAFGFLALSGILYGPGLFLAGSIGAKAIIGLVGIGVSYIFRDTYVDKPKYGIIDNQGRVKTLFG